MGMGKRSTGFAFPQKESQPFVLPLPDLDITFSLYMTQTKNNRGTLCLEYIYHSALSDTVHNHRNDSRLMGCHSAHWQFQRSGLLQTLIGRLLGAHLSLC